MAVVRRVHPVSLAKYCTVFFAVFGLIIGISMVVSDYNHFKSGDVSEPPSFSPLFVAPVLGGIIGFFAGALSAVLFNALSFLFGGLEVDID